MWLIFKIRYLNYLKHVEVKLTKDEKYYYIRSSYDAELVEELRAMKGSRWQPEMEPPAWRVPICERNDYAIQYLLGNTPSFNNISRISDVVSVRPLFEHQKQALNFAIHRRKCMLALSMGLGKTLTAIELMEYAARNSTTLGGGTPVWWLVAPYGAQQEWKRQLKKWNAKVIPSLITTYESLGKYMEVIDEPPDGVIFDESIKIKNPNAQRSQVANELCRLIRCSNTQSYIILLSGAPAPKEPTDWWHQIECIFPGWIREGDVHKFRRRYANLVLKDRGYGPFYEVESWKEDEVAKLGRRLAPLVLVKKKEDCLDLPDKIFDIIHCAVKGSTMKVAELLILQSRTGVEALEKLRELSDGFQYHKVTVEDHFKGNIYANTGILPTNTCGYTWIGSPKIEIIKQLLDFYHTDNGGCGRLIIYTAFHATVDYLMQYVSISTLLAGGNWNCDKIDGRGWSDPNILEKFDDEALDNYCIIANPACVHGISFARTECLVYYSNTFSVDSRIQSMDRRDRPGMDTTRGTRIVDIINLETDQMILDRLNRGIEIQEITLQEIKKCLKHDV